MKHIILNCFACGFSLGVALNLSGWGSAVCVILAFAQIPYIMKLYSYLDKAINTEL